MSDHERPLASRGRRDAKRIAKHLVQLRIAPELVLCSSAVRARETLELVRGALGAAAIEVEEGLYAASAEELLERLKRVPEGVASVMLIGHNPGLQDLALTLAATGGRLDRLAEKLPTGALATLAVPQSAWSELSEGGAELTAFVVPKQLG